ncbi:MAG: nucleotide exchange factor GrpE [Planctomycetota bacterium]|nr:nucleotide exchange factor GrpE [Planctomycetota bacterium]
MNASKDPTPNDPAEELEPDALEPGAAEAATDAADTPSEAPAASESAPEESEVERALREQTERADKLADRLKRVEAEFVNESKRLRRQADEQKKYAIERVVVDLIPLIDAVHTGITSLGDSEADLRAREGLDLIGKQLLEILGRHGVEPIEAQDQPFDPNLHEALFTQPRDDVDPNMVVDVLRPGFTLNERVVRAAEVAVSMAPPKPAVPAAEESEGDAPSAGDEGES